MPASAAGMSSPCASGQRAHGKRNGSKTDGASGPQIEQAGLKASEKATSNAAAKADQVMASTGANTNGMLLAAVALTGIGWTMLDMKRRRMDVTARHGRR